MPSYATPANMLERYDARTIGDLVSDDGVQVSEGDLTCWDAELSEGTQGEIPTCPSASQGRTNLYAAIHDASGEIESALLQAGRYSIEDLVALLAADGNMKYVLIRLCCDIAMRMLIDRRPWFEVNEAYKTRLDEAEKKLVLLRDGKLVFDIQKVEDAGLPSLAIPSLATIEGLSLAVDVARGHFYPNRRLP